MEIEGAGHPADLRVEIKCLGGKSGIRDRQNMGSETWMRLD